ncbi:MAG: ribosome-binding factor A [Omnitrophica bacterium]|nr:ribosome-binding factor A [Candidatus Omnitrophota bacterium]
MKPYRNLKIASLIQQELSQILVKEFNFEGALVTIIGVEVSGDLLQAKVELGIIPLKKGPAIFAIIEKRSRELQYKLLKKMRIRFVPRLRFKIGKIN